MRRGMNWKVITLILVSLCGVLLIYNNTQDAGVTSAQLEALDNRIETLRKLVETQRPQEEDVVVIYNRVPKTGSTSFAGIGYDLYTRNGFNIIHINLTKNSHVFSLSDQNISWLFLKTYPHNNNVAGAAAIASARGPMGIADRLSDHGDYNNGWVSVDDSDNEENNNNSIAIATNLDADAFLQRFTLHKDTIIIYNRVPKTGSTTFANIVYSICDKLKYNVIYLRAEKNAHVYSVPDQMRFVSNVSLWNEKKPALYHGHVAFLDFERFGVSTKPIYINIIREPLDRLISYYYFLRHGDDFRPHLKRRKSHNKETFDECVLKDGHDCDPENLWMQIPFFCGHAAECWDPGNQWALEMAKFNLVNKYLVVGVTEEMADFVAILEATLPRFFAGATELYNSGKKSHLRKTFNKTPPSEEILNKIKESEIYRMEKDFYNFAKQHFDFIKRRTFELKDGYLSEKPQQFMYEKIRPR